MWVHVGVSVCECVCVSLASYHMSRITCAVTYHILPHARLSAQDFTSSYLHSDTRRDGPRAAGGRGQGHKTSKWTGGSPGTSRPALALCEPQFAELQNEGLATTAFQPWCDDVYAPVIGAALKLLQRPSVCPTGLRPAARLEVQ